ncbi:glutathione S-transferase [Pseudomonadota bacterium AL_CKDN230030165-1A_HGKHYDSX7]
MLPILYSFRRCPYAMRARMALLMAGEACELREVVLRDKPSALLAASPKGTVPVLVLPDGQVLKQSLDIMHWTLARHDPESWLAADPAEPVAPDEAALPGPGMAWITRCDGDFKYHLDRYKYAGRYPGADAMTHRQHAAGFVRALDAALRVAPWLGGTRARLADFAVMPFVRQYAHTDPAWFDAQPWSAARAWLDTLTQAPLFVAALRKTDPWREGAEPVRLDGFSGPSVDRAIP